MILINRLAPPPTEIIMPLGTVILHSLYSIFNVSAFQNLRFMSLIKLLQIYFLNSELVFKYNFKSKCTTRYATCI